MSFDVDIYRSAVVLVKELDEGAPIFAANQAYELLRAGDMEGYSHWNKIRLAAYQQLWLPGSSTKAR